MLFTKKSLSNCFFKTCLKQNIYGIMIFETFRDCSVTVQWLSKKILKEAWISFLNPKKPCNLKQEEEPRLLNRLFYVLEYTEYNVTVMET
jgi:hypothetical protein